MFTKLSIKKNPVYLSLHGQFDLKDEEIASYINKIIKGQRTFFHDNDLPYYLISLIEGNQSRHMGGTGLTHSFTAFIPQGLDKQDYITLLALNIYIIGQGRKYVIT